MAKKNNQSEEEIDLTAFSWVNAGFNPAVGKPGCGGCHPGGGGLEYDRDGFRYNSHLQENPELSEIADGDYYRSKWDKTGVIEADCFICHLPGYFFKERVKQLGKLNFQWAIIAGSGIGQIDGAVKNDEVPRVTYNKRFFNDDGKIVFNMSAHPNSDNCLFCHGPADMIKRGFSWDDHDNHDIHNARNINCVTCHPATIEHQFAKGNENLSSVRNDLDDTILNCAECHQSGYMGAPQPAHREIRPNHLEKLACQVCHIPELGRSSAFGLDVSTGKVRLYPRDGAKKVGGLLKWFPEMSMGPQNKLYPVNAFQPNLFTNKDADGIFYPLFASEIEEAYETVHDQFSLLSASEPLIDTDKEIIIMLTALQQTLEDNPRFQKIFPCYNSGGRLLYLDALGALIEEQDTSWAAEPNTFNISHNVAPTRMSLGANGCSDCHAERAAIFSSWLAAKKDSGLNFPTDTQYSFIDDDSRVFYLNQLHKYNASKNFVIPFLFAGVFTLILFREGTGQAAYTFKRKAELPTELLPVVVWLLLIRNISFLFLTFTGLVFFFNKIRLIELFFATPNSAIMMHWATGLAFIGSILGCILIHKIMTRNSNLKICFLGLFGGKTLIGLMVLTGTPMIFRNHLAADILYLCSIVHTLVAFILMAVFAAKSFSVINKRLSASRQSEGND